MANLKHFNSSTGKWEEIKVSTKFKDLLNTVKLTQDQNYVNIGITNYNPVEDVIFVIQNSTWLQKDEDYIVNGGLLRIESKDGSNWSNGDTFNFVILKNVDKDALPSADGSLIQDGSITISKLAATIQNRINIIGSGTLSTISDNLIDAMNEINNKFNSSIVNQSLGFGMNEVIRKASQFSIAPKFNIAGKTIINQLGKDGNCEDTSKWSAWQTTVSLDNTNKILGSNGIKVTLTSNAGNINTGNLVSKYNIDITKYYLITAYLKNGNATNISIGKDTTGGGSAVIVSSNISDSTKFTRVGIVVKPSDLFNGNIVYINVNGTTGQYAYVDGVMINEITASEYSLGATTLLDKYPYVDSYVCLQNPYFEIRHDNLIRNGNGEEGISWWTAGWYDGDTHTNGTMTIDNYGFLLTDSNYNSGFFQKVNVKPNTTYYLSFKSTDNANGYMAVYGADKNTIHELSTSDMSFNSGNNSYVYVNMYNASSVNTIGYKELMLIEGPTAPSSYKSCRIENVVLETKLTSDDSITYDNGEVSGKIWWKHKTLFGKDYDWKYANDYAGFKALILPSSFPNGVTDSQVAIKYDGKLLSKTLYVNSLSTADTFGFGSDAFLTVPDTDTGWADTINPNNDEVKVFMNGWKALYNTGSRYVAWSSIIDNTFPIGATQTKLSSAFVSGATSLNVVDSSIFSVGDSICVICDDGVMQNRTINSISGNTLTILAINHNISINTVIVKSDNGTSNVSMLNYCKSNVAPGYEGYQLNYKLQNPEPITDDNCHIHGYIPKLDIGDNYLYVDSGIVLSEVANPVLAGGNSNYYLNDTTFNSPLKYKVESIINAYRNSIFDSKYNRSGYDTGRGYGREFIAWPVASFDVNSIYTVDYKILATQAPQIGSISCSYAEDIVVAINKVQEAINNKQNHDSILDNIIDSSLYEKTGIPYDTALPWFTTSNNGYLYASIMIPLSPKKCIPIVTLDSLRIVNTPSSSEIDITNKFTIYIIIKNNYVYIRLSTNDSATIASIKSYGVYISKLNITADCRGRI
jgi:hypothetical protein